jgi:alkylation response protein AidB-like acyl-CoA dehydrogenase
MATRAFDEAVRWSLARRQFGHSLSEFQATQMALADMQVEIAGARLL